MIASMDGPLPLPTLVSHALVAFTIEFDNEAERRLPHRTIDYGPAGVGLHAPWLVSMAMWFNCMRWLEKDGVKGAALALTQAGFRVHAVSVGTTASFFPT
jgi:hypothetical protein